MLIEIDKVKVNDRIRKDFGDIEELATDIKDNGLINPPVVTPEYELIAGERRLKAMKVLGYQQIEVRIMTVKDYEHQLNLEINENESRKEFTKIERLDYARRLEKIERMKAKDRQGERTDIVENFPQSEEGKTRDIVAEKMGIGSGKQYEKEKFIADNATPEILKNWDEGNISTHKAYQELQIKIKAEVELEFQDKLQLAKDELAFAEEDKKEILNRNSKLEKSVEKQKDIIDALKASSPITVEKEIIKEVLPEEVLEKIEKLEKSLYKETVKVERMESSWKGLERLKNEHFEGRVKAERELENLKSSEPKQVVKEVIPESTRQRIRDLEAEKRAHESELHLARQEIEDLQKLKGKENEINETYKKITLLQEKQGNLMKDSKDIETFLQWRRKTIDFFSQNTFPITTLNLEPNTIKNLKEDTKPMIEIMEGFIYAIKQKFGFDE